MDYLEVKFWKIAVWLIKKGYGDKCHDYVEDCIQCSSGRTINWIQAHIRMLEF